MMSIEAKADDKGNVDVGSSILLSGRFYFINSLTINFIISLNNGYPMKKYFTEYFRKKQVWWGVAAACIILLLITSTFLTKILIFTLLVLANGAISFFSERLQFPFDITPTTLLMMAVGHFYGPIWVPVFMILGNLLPEVLSGGGFGPPTFIYVPLNLAFGIGFYFIQGPLVPYLFAFMLAYSALVFIIDGFFLGSFGRSMLSASGVFLSSLAYLALIWRLQTIFGFM